MREIKFRGKTKIDGVWVIGSYVYTNDNTNNSFRRGPFKEKHQIIFYSSCDWNMGGWDFEEVDKETIGQYTGLKDKNGKEIYEGDIILWRNQKYVVKFQSGMFYASVEEFNKDVYGGFPLWGLVKYHDEPDCGVIVGNIYEYKEEEK